MWVIRGSDGRPMEGGGGVVGSAEVFASLPWRIEAHYGDRTLGPTGLAALRRRLDAALAEDAENARG